jgi:DNA-binding response OmpR family regulator/two-component sensor histidine kinase
MERNVTNLEHLIKQLLTFRKIETNSMEVVIKDYNISDVVNSCALDFKPVAEKKGLELILEIQKNVTGKIDKEKWELILRNLISNAIKYTNSGNVKINFAINDQSKATISIIDTGCGISEEFIPKIFNRFYRVSENEQQIQGIGIGLHLTKSLVEMLNGSIHVKSELNAGTTFSLRLPIDGSYSDTYEEDLVQAESGNNGKDNMKPQSLTKEPFLHDAISDSETFRNKNILLVEDNEDFRNTLKTTLEPFCKIYEAEDGLTAMEIAEKEDIDIIISDVMMPNQSGYELCHKIKMNLKTSHIPVILLTAMVGDENKLLGYRAGANAYIEKPVNMKLLLAQIKSLLINMKTFRRQTGVNLSLEPENVSITPLDEEFFNKAKQIVEKNISDSEFSIKDFANELCVSNSMLYRKIKSLTDSSPSEFIRNIRLKRSAQLLQNKAFTISEVAYKCGFNDLGYFGVCFKKMFGETPTSYQTNNQKSDIK